MKAIKAKLPEDQVADFEKKAAAYAKKIVAKFGDYEFYIGDSMDPDGMVALLNYREDGVTRKASIKCSPIIALITFPSLHHLLETRRQGNQVLISSIFLCITCISVSHRTTLNGQIVQHSTPWRQAEASDVFSSLPSPVAVHSIKPLDTPAWRVHLKWLDAPGYAL